METEFNEVMADLSAFENIYSEVRDTLLANLVMISEIPAPTFQEKERVSFMLDRFTELNLINTSTDEYGNALGILSGTSGSRNILLVSHLDTFFDQKTDHSVSIGPKTVTGPAVGHNAVGLAALTVLPMCLEKMNIKLRSNLILMGSSQSLGRGSIGGLRFFLTNAKIPITAGICVEGVKLGKISHRSIGMMRCEMVYSTPENYDWKRFGAIGAIGTLSEIVTRIREIPIPNKPSTSITFGSIESGTAYNVIATEGILKFEIRSETEEMVNKLKTDIESIVAEIASIYGIDVKLNVVGQRKPGGIPFIHPLTLCARKLLEHYDIDYWVQPSTSELSAFIDNNIPAITTGITTGVRKDKSTEEIAIEPIFKGLSALIGLVLSIDRGICDES